MLTRLIELIEITAAAVVVVAASAAEPRKVEAAGWVGEVLTTMRSSTGIAAAAFSAAAVDVVARKKVSEAESMLLVERR